MNIQVRNAKPDDIQRCGEIYFDAFKEISSAHNFPQDQPSVEFTTATVQGMLAHNDSFCLVAETAEDILGFAALHLRPPIGGIGPITVAPRYHGAGIGRLLMEALEKEAENQNLKGTRLVQAAYNRHSLSLYTKLGYNVVELLINLQGNPIMDEQPGFCVRTASNSDIDSCRLICKKVHGFSRDLDIETGIENGTAMIVERQQNITGYTCGIGFRAHSAALTSEDLRALISTSESFAGPGFLLPAKEGDLFRWCLERGLRVVQPMALMVKGWYQSPAGAYLPSVSF